MDERDLTYEDIEDIEVNPNWTGLDCLVVVAERAAELYKLQETLTEKKKKKKEEEETKKKLPLLVRDDSKKNSPCTRPVYSVRVCMKREDYRVDSKKQAGELVSRSREEILKRERLLKRVVLESTDSYVRKKKAMVMVSDAICEEREKLLKRPMIRETNKTSSSCVVVKKDMNKKPRKIKCGSQVVMPREYKNRIMELARGRHVSEEKFVIEKNLFSTDCSRTHCRLTIPRNQVVERFLTEEEDAELCVQEGTSERRPIVVTLVEPSLQRCSMCLRRWDLRKGPENSSVTYVLNGPNWNDVRERNGLVVGVMVRVWAVRVGGELWFVLLKVPPVEDEGAH